ncbi:MULTISPECIES: hypothetical protein [Pyrobaculum]|uniref:hypothetical protein n=1 Tax=Pyrobaculum TaxID=2276 RepID=UPI001F4D2E22|nr:hypothetical protein [Pyrobaculum arsenaticum]MCY0890220.1 hypothetical protein [Pyrobaculum arsenaticum]
MRIIRRRECAEVSRLSSWTLVYGRRKVGKTTLLKNCLRSDLYVLIGYGGSTAVVGEEITAVDNVLREVGGVLRRGGIAVVDEFQRLPPKYWDLVATWAPSGLLTPRAPATAWCTRCLTSRAPSSASSPLYTST